MVQLTKDDVEFDELDVKVVEAITHSASCLLEKMQDEQTNGSPYYRRYVWPTFQAKPSDQKIGLILVPLHRLGATQGFSGSHVMVGYFEDRTTRSTGDADSSRSYPLIIKVKAPDPDTNEDKLKLESDNAKKVEPYIYYADHFAIPFHLDENVHGRFSILWSRFASSLLDPISPEKSRLTLAEDNFDKLLKGLLRDKEDSTSAISMVETVLRDVFNLMSSLHSAYGKVSQERSVWEEYKWYLRGIEQPSAWGASWRTIWGNDNTQVCKDHCGAEWTNPFWVLKQLKVAKPLLSWRLCIGSIHGDLHPRNIVFTPNRSPHLIDFGWAHEQAHIAKDFVLLECNLRFMVLHPDVPYEHVNQLAAWINCDSELGLGHEYCDGISHLIFELRKQAKDHMAPDSDWDIEYIVPLFLVALGLLRHISECKNQMAAHRTVLELAKYIHTNVLSREGFVEGGDVTDV